MFINSDSVNLNVGHSFLPNILLVFVNNCEQKKKKDSPLLFL